MKKFLIILLASCWLFIRAGGQNITAAEYFIDTDPGLGMATSITIGSPGPNLTGVTFNANVASVSPGFHHLYFRTKDANNRWSLTNSKLFYKSGPETGPPQNIVSAEYFIDTDPGHGAATPITVTPGTNIVSGQFNAGIAAAPIGFHRLFIRTKDATGHWSLANALILYKKANAPDTLQFITAAEYFVDTDPGTGNANPIAIHEVKDLGNKQLYMNVTGLAAGEHRFYLRTKDLSGKWSLTNNEVFTLSAMSATPALIVNSISRTILCARDTFNVGYHVTGTYNNGNIFTAYLSNSSGSFAAETAIGSTTATTSGLIKCRIPSRVPDGSGYKLRVKSSNPILVGATSITSLTLFDRPDWGNDTTLYIVCQDEKVNLLPVFQTAGFTVQWNTPTPGDVGAGVYRLTSINANGCTDTVYATVKQDVGVWIGATSNNWHTASNWSNGHIPIEKTHVIIPPGTANPCVLSNANASVASIQVRSGGVINIINSRQVIITAKCNPLPLGP